MLVIKLSIGVINIIELAKRQMDAEQKREGLK